MVKRKVYPFTAILGQDRLKNALIWNLINPQIGGVLISGEKGTAKSTAVRGLADITSMSIVDMPINITEDCLIGAVDFEYAIKTGQKRFEAGILSKADGGILYIDEVNLLADNIVKAVLDVASSGCCQVEREGISASYPADFILVGSMNPEEGGIRPQFLDRFGLYVETQGESDVTLRVDIMKKRLEFEADEDAFLVKYIVEQKFLQQSIESAKKALVKVKVSSKAYELAAQIANDGNCQGHRGEIVIIETAKAIAASFGRLRVEHSHIVEAAQYALPHRMREIPPMPPKENWNDDGDVEENLEDFDSPEENVDSEDGTDNSEDNLDNADNELDNEDIDIDEDTNEHIDNLDKENLDNENLDSQNLDNEDCGDMPENLLDNGLCQEQLDEADDIFSVIKWLDFKTKDVVDKGSGRRSLVKTNLSMGRYVKSRCYFGKLSGADIAFDATLRAAAPYQKFRAKKGLALAIKKSDIRIKQREKRTGNYILFVVDASGSMGAGKRMSAVKGAILSLLSDAYEKRDKVGLIMFKNQSAEVVLDMTRSVDMAQRKLEELPTGGKTPLACGLELARRTIETARLKNSDILPVMVLVSDGRATFGDTKQPFAEAKEAAQNLALSNVKSIVIDAETGFLTLGLAKKIAEDLAGDYIKLDDLKAESLVSAVAMSI